LFLKSQKRGEQWAKISGIKATDYFIDALCITILTITTMAHGEVHALSQG